MTSPAKKRAVVIGAGLSGLSAAYRLRQANWDVTIFEAGVNAGGRVQTVARDGYLMDTGASAVAESYTAYIQLAEELGLRAEIVPAKPCVGVYRAGRVHELHLDRTLSLVGTKLLSWSAKLRMARLIWDIVVAKLRGQLDYSDMARAAPLDTESADDYGSRVIGREATDYFASPIVRVMLIADADKISKVELLSGVANIMSTRISALRGGQGRLPQVLAATLAPRFKHRVDRVLERAGDVEVTYRDAQGASHVETFDAAVVSCPLPEAARMCEDKRNLLQPLNAKLGYTQCITVALAFSRAPQSGAFLIHMPTCEDAEIALLFLDHNKSADRAPAGCGLIDCHWETGAATQMMDRSDEEIVARSLQTVYRVFPELRGHLNFSHVTRWRHALPLTAVGAYRLIGDFNAALDPRARVQFAADYMSEAGQNSAIDLGHRAARTLQAAYS